MKYKGVPNLFVRINKPRKGEVKFFTFDDDGIYETEHPTTMQRLESAYEIVLEDVEDVVEEKEIDYTKWSYEELQAEYANKTGNSPVGVSKVNIIKELEVE